MTTPRVLLFGHSHMFALNRALVSGGFRPRHADWDWQMLLAGTVKFPGRLVGRGLHDDKPFLNPVLMSALADHKPMVRGGDRPIWLVSVAGGNHYNAIGMLASGGYHDFVVPRHEHLPLSADACPLPWDAVAEVMAEQLRDLPVWFRLLATLGYQGIVHLGAPPPHPSSEQIRALLAQDPKWRGKPLTVTPAWVRLKWWLLQERLTADHCAAAGISYLAAPAAARDENGFLQVALCQDAAHGTGEYGALMLRALESHIAEAGGLS